MSKDKELENIKKDKGLNNSTSDNQSNTNIGIIIEQRTIDSGIRKDTYTKNNDK